LRLVVRSARIEHNGSDGASVFARTSNKEAWRILSVMDLLNVDGGSLPRPVMPLHILKVWMSSMISISLAVYSLGLSGP
jgi:hypothetical protein